MTNLRRVFVEVFQICHIFNFENIRYVVKVIFFSIKLYRKIYFVTEFCYFFFYCHICTLGLINSFLQKKKFLPRLIKQERFRSLHCMCQGVYVLNTRSIKSLRRSVVKVFIMLLIKQ